MDIIKTGKKGRHLNTLENYHIYKIRRNNLYMNNTHIEAHNPVFRTVQEFYQGQQHTRYLERYLSANNYTKHTKQHHTHTTKRAAQPMGHISKRKKIQHLGTQR